MSVVIPDQIVQRFHKSSFNKPFSKRIRDSFDKQGQQSALHIVTAYATEQRL